ncbi:MAG: aldose 1-epimerase family protein [Thermoguttaceae bacterium]
MPRKSWTLTDVDADIYVEQLFLGPREVGGAASGYSVTKRRLHGGLRDGVDVVEVDNGRLRFTIVPTRGMGIWRASCGDVEIGWKSPVRGPVHPAFVPLSEPSGSGWLSGFDELLVRCGLENNGAPEFLPNGALRYPLHGRIANIPAHKVEVTIDGESGEIAVFGVVEEARLFGVKLRLTTTIRTRVGQPAVTVDDEITNLSAEPSRLQLFYHVNLGHPLVGPGAKLLLPVKRMAPCDAIAAADIPHWNIYAPELPGVEEVCHFFEPAADASGWTRALLRSADGQRGVSVQFDNRQLPRMTLWKNRQAIADGYVTGIEPGINFPNRPSFEEEQGRVARLAPGESRHFEVILEAHCDAASVALAEQAVATAQNGAVPEICAAPDPKWSPSA